MCKATCFGSKWKIWNHKDFLGVRLHLLCNFRGHGYCWITRNDFTFPFRPQFYRIIINKFASNVFLVNRKMIAQPLDYLMRVYLLSPSIILPEVASIHDHHTRKAYRIPTSSWPRKDYVRGQYLVLLVGLSFRAVFSQNAIRKECRTWLQPSKSGYIFQKKSCYYTFLGMCPQRRLRDHCLRQILRLFRSSNQAGIHVRCRILKCAKRSFVPML